LISLKQWLFQERVKNLLSVKVSTALFLHKFMVLRFFFGSVVNTTHVNSDDPEAVELSSSDIKCLNPGVYLSSPVINYYIQLRIYIPIFKFTLYHSMIFSYFRDCLSMSFVFEVSIIGGNHCRI
jgi:hypothetical protein